MATAGVVFDLAMAAFIGAVRAHGTSTGQWHAEGPWATAAFVALVAGPGVAGLLGLRLGRADLLGAAGAACAAAALPSVATFPLVLVGLLLLVAFARHPIRSLARTGLTAVTLLAGTLAALGMLLSTASCSYSFPGGSEGGDYVPAAHAALAIALVVMGLATATAVAVTGPPD